jgi:hypothetical protein
VTIAANVLPNTASCFNYSPADDLILLRGLWLGRSREDYGAFALQGTNGADALSKLVVSERFFVEHKAAQTSYTSTPFLHTHYTILLR